MRILVAALLALPLSATANVDNALSPNRTVTVTARTAAHARCTLTDSLTGLRRQGTASGKGRATWRWQPSVWADGADTISVSCTKGRAHGSTETFLPLATLPQIGVLRRYRLHLVYWAPAHDMPATVPPAIARLEADVKASLDAGATDTPFAVPRAYGDSLGKDDPRIVSIDTTIDTHAYPKAAAGYCRGVPKPCLASTNVGDEADRLARMHRWMTGNHTFTLIFTAPSLSVCDGRGCTPASEVCGYHAVTTAGDAYADIILSSCGASGSFAEYAIAVTGHEQNEAVVDPLGYGVEIADKCRGDLESTRINGHAYRLPALVEHGRCVFGYTR